MAQNEIPKIYYNQSKEVDAQKSNKWWLAPPEKEYECVFPLVKRIRKNQSYRSVHNLRYARLYTNSEMVGLRAGQFSKVADPKSYMLNRVTYNVIKSCIDAATAKIAASKPRPLFLTDNGSWNLQQRAKRLSQFIQGVFGTIGTGTGVDRTMYGLGQQCFTDAAIFGLGTTYFFTDDNEVKAERNIIEEIVIDDTEGMYRQPRQIHRVRQAFKDVLKELYPKFEREISECAMVIDEADSYKDTCADLIDVIESWHLPSGKGAKDGRHTISIGNATLFSEPWEEDYFPFLFQRWCHKPIGFYGTGLAEELCGIQLEINKLLRNIQISQHLMSVPQVWLETSSQAVTKHINNEIGGIKFYAGKPPIFNVPPAMSGEVYQHLETLYNRAFEITGISQMSATSRKPAGLDSAVAQREYKDTETERFAIQAGMYEDYYMEATQMIIKLCRKLKAEGKEPIVKFKDGNSMKMIKFSEVDIPDDQIVIKAYPTNFLPSTPAGKLQTIQELTQAGFYTKEESLELIDFPDLEKVNRIKLAPREDVIKLIEGIIESGDYQQPEPFMNLELAKTLSQSYYLRGRADDMPEERLELLRTFMDDVQLLIDKRDEGLQMMQQAAMAPEMTGDPTAVAAQPQVSDLISNVPAA